MVRSIAGLVGLPAEERGIPERCVGVRGSVRNRGPSASKAIQAIDVFDSYGSIMEAGTLC
jgi:hypothetical protein